MSLKEMGQLGKVVLNHLEETEGLILARFEPAFLVALMKMWRDKEQPKSRLTQERLAKATGLSQRAIASYCTGESQPDRNALDKLGRFFGIHWVEDYDHIIPMDKLLESLKALSSSN